MKQLYFSILAVSFPVLLQAQNLYKPGYVITQKGDTLRGWISYRQGDRNPDKLSFSAKREQSGYQSYTVNDISAFGYNNEQFFQRYKVKVSLDQVEMSNIKQGIDSSFTIRTVFLKRIAAGKNILLYKYTDEIKTRYYIQENTAIPTELIYRQYYSPTNNTYVQTDNVFIDQLKNEGVKYNADQLQLDQKLKNTEYNEGDILRIAALINGTNYVSKSAFGVRFFAGAGIINNVLHFNKGIDFPYKSSIAPKIDAGIDILPNMNNQTIFFRLEFALSDNQHEYIKQPQNAEATYSLSNVKQTNISIVPQVIYNFYNTAAFKAFIAGGVSLNFSSYNSYRFTEQFDNSSNSIYDEFPTFRKVWSYFPVRAGVFLHNKIQLYVSYAPEERITTDNENFFGGSMEFQAGINYLFGGK